MIKVTVLELLNAEPALGKLQKKAEEDGVSFDLAAKIVKLIGKLQPEYKDIYEQRSKIFNKFGTPSEEDSTQISILPKNLADFNKYWGILLKEEVEVFNVFKLSYDSISTVGGFSLTDAAQLLPFVDQPDDSEKEPESRKKIEVLFETAEIDSSVVETE
jgi:hypothetical protein